MDKWPKLEGSDGVGKVDMKAIEEKAAKAAHLMFDAADVSPRTHIVALAMMTATIAVTLDRVGKIPMEKILHAFNTGVQTYIARLKGAPIEEIIESIEKREKANDD